MKLLTVIVISVAASISAVASADQGRTGLERLPTVTINGKAMPFSAGVRVGDVLFLSGQIGVGTDGKLPAGFQAQAKNTLDHIGATLKGAGLSWNDVIRCTILLSDMANWPTFNDIYAAYVDPKHLPARSALGTSGLALGALVEVQCDAYDPPK